MAMQPLSSQWLPHFQKDFIPDSESLTESTRSDRVTVEASDNHAGVASVGAEDADAAEGPSEALQGHRVSQ